MRIVSRESPTRGGRSPARRSPSCSVRPTGRPPGPPAADQSLRLWAEARRSAQPALSFAEARQRHGDHDELGVARFATLPPSRSGADVEPRRRRNRDGARFLGQGRREPVPRRRRGGTTPRRDFGISRHAGPSPGPFRPVRGRCRLVGARAASGLVCAPELPLRLHAAPLLLRAQRDRDRRVVVAVATAHFGGRRRIPRGRCDEYWDDLVSLAIARPEDRAESDPHFTDTNRTSASPRPGCGSGATGRWRKPRRSTTRGAIAAATEERPSTTASRRSP